jgi:death-on-curing protein
VDGNKRTGAVAALLFLDLNEIEIDAAPGELYENTIAVANGTSGKKGVTDFFQVHAVTR